MTRLASAETGFVGSFFHEIRIPGGTGERRGRPSMAGPSLARERPVKPSLAQTARSATPSTPSPSFVPNTNPRRATTSTAASPRARPNAKPCALKRHIFHDAFKRLDKSALMSLRTFSSLSAISGARTRA